MSRNLGIALALIGLSVIVLILNHGGGPLGGSIKVNLGFTELSAIKSLVFFGFIVVGVAIGLLVK